MKVLTRIGLLCTFFPLVAERIIPEHEIAVIGLQVWRNEDSRRKRNLVTWNKGEEGASLGIGHFTWYPQNTSRQSTGTFPSLVAFLEKEGKSLPKEFGQVDNLDTFYAPWPTRQDFVSLSEKNDPRIQALRKYLLATIDLQMRFITERIEKTLPILRAVTKKQPMVQQHVEKQFHRLAATSNGRYALVDYTNLAGEGGLLKVLRSIKGTDKNSAVEEFVASAQTIMANRVANAKNAHHSKWLPGWNNRIKTYLTFNKF